MLKIMAMIIRKRNENIIDDRKNDEKMAGCETCEFLCKEITSGTFSSVPWYSCNLKDPDFEEGRYIPEDYCCKYYVPNSNYRKYLKRKKKRSVKNDEMRR